MKTNKSKASFSGLIQVRASEKKRSVDFLLQTLTLKNLVMKNNIGGLTLN